MSNEVIEIPVEQAEVYVRTELCIGVDSSGSVYYKISGTDQSYLMMEGLLKYARLEMDRLWSKSFAMERKTEAGA